MSTITLDHLKQNLDESLDRTCIEHEPLIIQREGKDSLLVMRAADFGIHKDDPGMAETLFLLSDPQNAGELLKSIAAANRGELVEHDLIEE